MARLDLSNGLSADVIRFMLEYLDYDEKIQLIMIKTTFSHTFLKSTRIITKSLPNAIKDKETILSLIKDPQRQLNVLRTFDLHQKITEITEETMKAIREKERHLYRNFQIQFPRIQGLFVSVSQKYTQYVQSLNEFPYIVEMNNTHHHQEEKEDEEGSFDVKHLTLRHSSFISLDQPTNSFFPLISNLESASFIGCRDYIIPLQYGYLHKLCLTDCRTLEDVNGFKNIYDLTLIRCDVIRDISALQNNHTITIENCLNIADYSKSFENTVFIRIESINSVPNAPKLCNLKQVQSVTLKALDTASLPLHLPTSLRYYSISSYNFKMSELTGFETLKHLRVDGSEVIYSVEMFGSIPILELHALKNLQSLQGLGHGNRKLVISNCDKLTDFSPLRYIDTVVISDCKGFKNEADVDRVRDFTFECTKWGENVRLCFRKLSQNVERLCLSCVSNILASAVTVGNVPIIELRFKHLFDPIYYLNYLWMKSHQKIVIYADNFASCVSKFPINNLYHRYIFLKRNLIVYLLKT